MATAGQLAVYRLGSSRYMQAIVTKVISGDQVELVVFSDGYAWGDGDPASLGAKVYDYVDFGTSVGQWQPSAQMASTPYVNDTAAGLCCVPAAGSSVSLTLATPRQPSASRPVRVSVYGNSTAASTLLTPQNVTIELRADSSTTPTTVVGGPVMTTLGGVLATMTAPWTLTYDVPAGHYYQVVQSAGAGTASITHVNEQVM